MFSEQFVILPMYYVILFVPLTTDSSSDDRRAFK